MYATTYGPRVPALTPARVTRLAKPAAPELRWTSERGARGILVRVWDAALEGEKSELRLLNAARDLIRAADLSASVVAVRSRGGRTQFRVLVTSEAEEAAAIAKIGADRAAALEAAREEVAAGRDRDHAEALAMEAVREEAAAEPAAHRAYRELMAATALTRQRAEGDRHARVMAHRTAMREEDRARAGRETVLADTTAHYEALAEQALAARVAADAAWEEEAHAAGFATGADYGEFLVAETVDVPEPDHEFFDGDDSLPEVVSARMLPSEEEPPAAVGVASTDSHRAPAPTTLPCYHVTTVRGEVYGVAATSVRDALQMTQDRLSGEGSDDLPKGARKVGRWAAAYGTVLHY